VEGVTSGGYVRSKKSHVMKIILH